MSTYNPYQSRERHRRAKPREGMTVAEYMYCAVFTVGMVVFLWIAAIS